MSLIALIPYVDAGFFVSVNGILLAAILFLVGVLVGYLARISIMATVVLTILVLLAIMLGIVSPSGMVSILNILGFSMKAAYAFTGILVLLNPFLVMSFLVGVLVGIAISR